MSRPASTRPTAPAGIVDLQASLGPLLDPSVGDATVAEAVDLLADVLTVAHHLDVRLISASPEGLADTAGLAALLDGAWLVLKDTGTNGSVPLLWPM